MKKVMFFILPALLFASCQKETFDIATVPDSESEISLRAPGKAKAFSATVTWQWIQQDDGVDCLVEPGEASAERNSYKMTGHASHMGHITGYWFTCVQLPSGNCTQGNGTMMASNWNNLYYTFDQMKIVRTEYPYMYFEGNATITGGTGRFENATGEFIITGFKDMYSGPYAKGEFMATGTITY